eukprot:3478598-Pyramimonas_sp.AAC.1
MLCQLREGGGVRYSQRYGGGKGTQEEKDGGGGDPETQQTYCTVVHARDGLGFYHPWTTCGDLRG